MHSDILKPGRILRTAVLALSLTLPPGGHAAEAGARLSLKVNQMTEDQVEGPAKSRSYLELGPHKIALREPTDCLIQSDPERMTIDLRRRGLDGVISVSRSPVDPRRGFDPATVNDYSDAATGLLRSDATELKVLGARVDPYVGNGWKGIAFQFSYEASHEVTRQEVAFVNYDETNQLVISVESSEESFDKALALAIEFLSSWYPMAGDAVVSYN